MTTLKTVCVYCGSSDGTQPAYKDAARLLGEQIAKSGLRLVYGGGSLGLMGTVAKATLAHGGPVTGIIPGFLHTREVMLEEVDDLVVTDDMHQRKRLMFEKADAFIALPGGIGTLEELVEMLTWEQLGRHDKPILLANIGGFWDPLISLIDHMRDQRFIRPDSDVRYLVENDPRKLIDTLLSAARDMPDPMTQDGSADTIEKL